MRKFLGIEPTKSRKNVGHESLRTESTTIEDGTPHLWLICCRQVPTLYEEFE